MVVDLGTMFQNSVVSEFRTLFQNSMIGGLGGVTIGSPPNREIGFGSVVRASGRGEAVRVRE